MIAITENAFDMPDLVTDPREVRDLLREQHQAVKLKALPRQQKEARLKRCEKDWKYFLTTYLPHRFHKDKTKPPPFAKFHKSMWEDASILNQLVVIAGFRESAKSTLTTIGRTIYELCFEQTGYTIIGAYNEGIARRLCDPIMAEFETNHALIADFGDQVTRRRWSSKEFRLKNGATVEALGIGQTPRGAQASKSSDRPDRFVGDDLLSTKTAVSEVEKVALRNFLFSDVLPALRSPVDGGFRATVVATPIDERSLISELLFNEKEYPQVVRRIYPMMNKACTKSNWPERFSVEDCLMKKQNLPIYSWLGEYLIDPIGDKSKLFDSSMIHYYKEGDNGEIEYMA